MRPDIFIVIIIKLLLLVACYCDDTVRMPPSITVHPMRDKIFRVDDEVTLECIANGVPAPRYEWRKNGALLDALPNMIYIGNGTILLSPLTTLDEGYYQCFAYNDYGATMSSVALLRRAMITSNPPMDVKEYKVTEGRLMMLRCQQTKSYPKPYYTWSVSSSSGWEKLIRPDSRIQIDEQGNLHFAYLNLSDSYDGSTYKCRIKNIWLGVEYGGSYARLNISQDLSDETESEQQFGPLYAFSSPSQVTGLLGGNVSLRCFFYGRPIPEVQWYRDNGSVLLLADRFVLSNYNTELVIVNLSLADEAVYRCSASNEDVTVLRSIVVKVEVAPTFQSANSRPSNVNVTEGSSVSLVCRTYAKPVAAVTWLQNGVIVNAGTLSPRYSLNSDGTVLTISNLCRECPDGKSDLQVIQCNASNQHGYAFGAGYVNVLKKTIVVTSPQYLFIEVAKRAIAKFTCTANSDPSTPVSINWYRIHEGSMTKIVLTGDDGDGVVVDKDHSLIFRSTPGSVKWLEYLGVYRCLADNGYSMESSDIQLIAMDLPSTRSKQDVTTNASVTEAEVAAANTELYWIAVLVALLIALLVIIIVVITLCCCRGDIYNVDKIEHKDYKDPEKELKDNELKEYCRPEEKTTTRASRSSVVTSSSHDEDFNEIEDEDDGNFGETGSFIGAYVEKR